jgi:hypothetical protein
MEYGYFGPAPWEWTRTITVGDQQVRSDLNCDEAITTAQLDAVVPFVQHPAEFDALARARMAASRADGAAVIEYVEHHLAELPDDVLLRLFGTTVRSALGREQLLPRMRLVRIGLYPAGEYRVALFDYSLDPAETDYVLSVSFDVSGKLASIDMES